MCIRDRYQKQESRQENAKFLKAEYGIGSYSNAIPNSGFRADHDSKGITISRDYGDPDGKFLLTWAKAEKRIGELIAAGRYLNRAEQEQYAAYREMCIRDRLEAAVYLRGSDTNETSDGRFALYPLEYRADSEPGNTAGGHGLGVIPQLFDCQRRAA